MDIILLILVASGHCSGISSISEPRSINPNCNFPDEAVQCEDDCLEALTVCYRDCVDDHDCINNCMRQHSMCFDSCPCHSDCYDGCPCQTESIYCLECEEKYESEFGRCQTKQREILNTCFINCDTYDDDCESRCFIKYKMTLKNCPCMENCENGCPCPNYDCTTDEHNGNDHETGGNNQTEYCQGKLQTQPMELNGECYQNFFNTTVQNIYYGKVTQNTANKQSLSSKCINLCKDLYHNSYKYAALERGGVCFCGGAEPYKELHGQCGMPCTGSHTDYCGGPGNTATFYSLENTNQRCSYGVEESVDHEFNVTTIVASDKDKDRKSCWAKFSCPSDYTVQYYFHYFATYFETYVAQYPHIVYLYNNPLDRTDIIEYYGNGNGNHMPALLQWLDTSHQELKFEFRTYKDLSSLYGQRGFKMRLRCHRRT